MMSAEEIRTLRRLVADGDVALDELPLHLEPLLWEARSTAADETTIKRLMNDLELILFTHRKGDQLGDADALLKRAESFVSCSGSVRT